MKTKICFIAAGFLAACAPPTATVSDYNGASVKIQTSQLADAAQTKANALTEANRICARNGKKAEYASTINKQDYTSEHLFMCL